MAGNNITKRKPRRVSQSRRELPDVVTRFRRLEWSTPPGVPSISFVDSSLDVGRSAAYRRRIGSVDPMIGRGRRRAAQSTEVLAIDRRQTRAARGNSVGSFRSVLPHHWKRNVANGAERVLIKSATPEHARRGRRILEMGLKIR